MQAIFNYLLNNSFGILQEEDGGDFEIFLSN
jgi:hypothetical protein